MTDPGLVFGALADDTRRTVFVRVAASGQATASELARDLPVTRQAVAKHLAARQRGPRRERAPWPRNPLPRPQRAPQRRDRLDGAVGERWDDRLARLARLADS